MVERHEIYDENFIQKKVMNNEKCKNDDNFNGATRSCPEMVEQHELELGEFHLCPPGDTTKSVP